MNYHPGSEVWRIYTCSIRERTVNDLVWINLTNFLIFRLRLTNESVSIPRACRDEDKAQWILQYTRAMQQELAELVDSVPWKWWAKYQKFDQQNARVEVIDLFHFLISLAQVLGMSAEDVHEIYTKKNKVNHKRQDSGYSEKDTEDSRHI